jgi:Tol biopolymer transport system component
MLLVGALTVMAAVLIGPGASGVTRDGLLVFKRYASCEPLGPGCYDAIYVASTNGTGIRRLTTTDDGGDGPVDGGGNRPVAVACDRSPAWSPDGRRIACGQDGVRIVNVDGTHPRIVPGTRPFQVTGLDWAPDGKRLAFEHFFSRIYVVNLDGSGRKLIAVDAEYPRWSPDGKAILFVRSNGGGIYVVGAGGGPPRPIHWGSGSVWSATWSSDGTQIAFFEGDDLHVLRLADKRDRLIKLRPSICAGDFSCFDIDWQRLPSR